MAGQLHRFNGSTVTVQEELQSKLDAVAAENLSLKHQLEATCRRNDQLQAALRSMEDDVTSGRDREQEFQRHVRYFHLRS